MRIVSKNFHDFLDRVPIASGDRHTQAFLDPAEVADRLHLPTIQTQDESVLDRNDLQQPVTLRRQTEGKRGSVRRPLANTLTNRTMFGPEGCRENGSFDASLMMSRAGQIMISHLNGSFRANAARKTDSLTSSRTTNVPTAPMLTMPNFANCFAISAGRHRLVPPTFTARRNTIQRIAANCNQRLRLDKSQTGVKKSDE
jgi:hypothetical protein